MTPRRTALLAGAALVASAATGAHAATTSSVAKPLVFERLSSVMLPGLSTLTPTGQVPASQGLRVGVALQRPHGAAEQAFLAAVENPSSPSYHRYLTPAQVADRFGVSHAVTSLMSHRLTSAGLHVDSITTAGDYLSVSGTAAQVEKAFDVQLNTYTSRGIRFFANATPPSVPAVAHVLSVVGLNSWQHFQRPTVQTRPAQDTCAASICTGYTTPQDLWSVYEQPTAYQGEGQQIAIIGEGSTKFVVAALPAFEKKNHLPTMPIVVHCVQGTVNGTCGSDTGGDVEWEIDTQASTGMAPAAKNVQLYFAKTIYDNDLNQSFLHWIDDTKGPTIANASLGECEATPANDFLTGPLAPLDGNLGGGPTAVTATGNGEEYVLDPQLVKAHLEGRTLFASTGDTGSSCPEVIAPGIGAGNGIENQGVPQVNYPAASPDATGVGGTVLYTKDGSKPAQRSLEYAWTHGGGGSSLFEAAPAWQAGVSAIVGRCVSDSHGGTGNTGKLCRGVPDIASQSGDVTTNGYALTDPDGSMNYGGGTSLSSPLWAGMWARVQSASLKNTGKTAGFAPPQIYKVGLGERHNEAFNDITTGVNGVYPTTPGWDYDTGFGTPRIGGLIKILAPKRVGVPVGSKGTGTTSGTRPPTSGTTAGSSLPTTGLGVTLPALAMAFLVGTAITARRRKTA